ncbi:PRO1 [Candida margitis]|uniref:PRO1 n=1 Tax=Candida margitis TaxID=1775924 RepID=UPI002226244B|nr:PRO1 [Candida margitis]KAI5963936.1 PRO1 [Candida margitis]
MSTSDSKKQFTIVVKIGSSSLVDAVTREPRIANMALIVETITKLRRQGHRIIIVSSGAIAFGMKVMRLEKKPSKLSAVQALASIGQGRLIGLFNDMFRQMDQTTAQILITRNDIVDYTQYKNAQNTINELLELGVIPIVNENDTLSVSEIKFGDNDTLSAITAGMIHADYLFLMTDVECLYSDNPRTNPNAEPILVVDNIDDLNVSTNDEAGAGSNVGTGGMTTKLIAAGLATNVGVTTIITLSTQPHYILDIVAHIQSQREGISIAEQRDILQRDIANKIIPLHTRFLSLPQDSQIKSDKRFWILHGLKTKGALIIDEGCFTALTRRDRAGLLPAGVIDVVGNFHENECVSIKVVADRTKLSSQDMVEVGHCRVNYTANEIRMIKGHRSNQIESILGYADSEYVAHRDNLAFPPVTPSSSN